MVDSYCFCFGGLSAGRIKMVGSVGLESSAVGNKVSSKRRIDGEDDAREIVMGRNVHTTCLSITEPNDDDEFTGDKDAYMASVLARYRKNLVERTSNHLGTHNCVSPSNINRYLCCVICW